jgi:hypothetical protein
MPDLILDWAWLYLQIVLLAFIAFKEIRRVHGRNVYAILVPCTMLVLVQGQAWWMLRQFESNHEIAAEHLYNTIRLDMARLANFYIGLGVLAYLAAYLATRKRKSPEPIAYLAVATASDVYPLSYALVATWTALAGGLLIRQVGGLQLAVEQPGRLIAGQTVFLIAVGMSKWPLIYKIAANQKIKAIDIALWSVSVIVTLFNSRFMTAFAVLQLAIVVHYFRKELSRRALSAMVVPAIGIFLVFGLYRDYAFRFGTVGAEAAQEFLARPDEWHVADWFYRTNVEGFTGLAGALTHQRDVGDFNYDFGVSELVVFTNLVPNALRNNPSLPFYSLSQFLQNTYPFTASVVPSGLESAYAHLGLPGILAYSALLGFLTNWFHRRAIAPGPKRLQAVVVSVQLLNGVRASLFFSLVFFGLGDLVMLWLYRLFLRIAVEVRATRRDRGSALESNAN